MVAIQFSPPLSLPDGQMNAHDITISSNSIQTVTETGIAVIQAGGAVAIENNVVVTGDRGRSGLPGSFVQGIRSAGRGVITIQNNVVICGFPNGAGIRLQATTGAIVRGNDITMEVSPLISNDALNMNLQSAGIVIEGTATDNGIFNNTLSGRARVALSVIAADTPADRPPGTLGNPVGTRIQENDVGAFAASFSDLDIRRSLTSGNEPADTLLSGASATTIYDDGLRTIALAWDDPGPIVVGTALSSAQLDAAANIAGTFTYTPAGGTLLGPGKSQPLTAAFMPADVTTYSYHFAAGRGGASASAAIDVVYMSDGSCLGEPSHTILQPIAADGSSIFSRGRPVSARFRVCDTTGASIGSPDVVAGFVVVEAPDGPLPRAVDSATPHTVFRWDPQDQQWVFNIATDRHAPPGMYALTDRPRRRNQHRVSIRAEVTPSRTSGAGSPGR